MKVKKIVVMLLVMVVLVNGIIIPNDISAESNDLTVKQAKDIFDNYLESKNQKLTIGTAAYTDYVMGMLNFEPDSEWAEMEQYKDLQVFAAAYIVAIERYPEQAKKGIIPKEIANKTIKQLKLTAQAESMEAEQFGMLAENENEEMLENADEITAPVLPFLFDEVYAAKKKKKTPKYSSKNAVKYAWKYFKNYNKNYHEFGVDCTNFMSQAVRAGGKKIKPPKKKPKRTAINPVGTKKNWFMKRYAYVYYVKKNGKKVKKKTKLFKYSSRWSTVSGFYSYWRGYSIRRKENKKQTATYVNNHKGSAMQNVLKKGDIVQLYRGDRWYHSVMITDGKKGDWRYAAHTKNYQNKLIRDILKNEADQYRIIRIGGYAK